MRDVSEMKNKFHCLTPWYSATLSSTWRSPPPQLNLGEIIIPLCWMCYKWIDRNTQEASFVNKIKALLKKSKSGIWRLTLLYNIKSAWNKMYFDFSPYPHPKTHTQTQSKLTHRLNKLKMWTLVLKILNRLSVFSKYKILGSLLLCQCKYIIFI